MSFSILEIKNIFGSIKIKGLSFFKNLRVQSSKKKYSAEEMTIIEEQKTVNVLVASEEQKKLFSRFMGGTGSELSVESLISPDSDGTILPVVAPVDRKIKTFLSQYLQEYRQNPTLFLDKERLFSIYKERSGVDFSEEELVFLLQSSLKNDFPCWFWSFFYREKYGNVMPLFRSAYNCNNSKIRMGVITGLNKFTDVNESIVKLAETEEDEDILGIIVIKLHKKKETDLVQRVIANALTRRIVPSFEYKPVKNLKIDLGTGEKRFLHKVIKEGWANEKNKALNVLSLAADESDLSLIEGLLESETYRETTLNTLNCIARIGKTNRIELIENELLNSKLEKYFIESLNTLIAVGHKKILPKLFDWLKDSSSFNWRFSDDLHQWQLTEKIERAILSLIDEDFYEVIIKDILSNPKNEYTNLYTWRQFNLLKETKDKKIIKLIKKEDRLSDYSEWQEVLDEIKLREISESKDKKELFDVATPNNYTAAMFSLREVWKIINQEEAINIQSILEKLRADLNLRLQSLKTGEHSQHIKELAKKELDYFLGENRVFYKLFKSTKRDIESVEETTGKDEDFEKLNEDIEKFERIEDEYISFISKEKNEVSAKFILKNLGRPYESIYKTIIPDWIDADELSKKLKLIIDNDPNPLIKLNAITAAIKAKVLDKKDLRQITLKILDEFKNQLKANQLTDRWFVNHILYGSAINTLAYIGMVEDLPLIDEAINREETIFDRTFFNYSYFHHEKSFERLLALLDILKKEGERENAIFVLDSIDYEWTKELLGISS